MKIEIAISCSWFQRRLCWMLSSLAQQIDAPELIVNVAYTPNNGTPTTEQVCELFRPHLNLKETIVAPEDIPFRGKVRNVQLAASSAEWLLFSDTDMVYSTYFFNDLGGMLAGPLANETRCISASRISLDKEHCKQAMSLSPETYPKIIENAAELVAKFPVNRGQGNGVRQNGMTRNVGAGYFQLANVTNLRTNHKGIYWDSQGRRDPSWGYRSDRQFRRRIGGICPITTLPQYHLNHERDSEEGRHVEMQR